MKKINLILAFLTATASLSFAEPEWASIYHSLIAFDKREGLPDGNRPGYVKPLATNLGTVLNSNWYASASVPEVFSFEAGLPIALVTLGTDDQEYAGGAPTIFGDKKYEWGTTAGMIGSSMSCTTAPNCNVVNGNETLNKLGVFTYPYLQLAGGFYHARVVLRGMYLPSISELQGFNLFGFGLQYSFGHLFRAELPSALQGLDVSLVFGMNFSGISYQPEDYVGTLDLDVTTTNFALVIGYKPLKMVEIMLSLGYETASMESSGHLTSHDPDSYGAEIFPSLSVDGNNGFRLGLSVAFSLGSAFNPVLGVDFGTKTSFTTNILYFKQQFGEDPEPVKKEKAERPSQAVSNDDGSVEETPLQKKRRAMKAAKSEEPEETSEDEEF